MLSSSLVFFGLFFVRLIFFQEINSL